MRQPVIRRRKGPVAIIVGSGRIDEMESEPDFKLKITKDKGEIWIRGNKKGLEYLSEICLRVIGKTDPSGHFHITPEMGNASAGSEPALLEFSEKDEHYE